MLHPGGGTRRWWPCHRGLPKLLGFRTGLDEWWLAVIGDRSSMEMFLAICHHDLLVFRRPRQVSQNNFKLLALQCPCSFQEKAQIVFLLTSGHVANLYMVAYSGRLAAADKIDTAMPFLFLSVDALPVQVPHALPVGLRPVLSSSQTLCSHVCVRLSACLRICVYDVFCSFPWVFAFRLCLQACR
jgi:hypothetical protein